MPCLVKYRAPSPEERSSLVRQQQVPGPDYYYSKDDLIYSRKPVYTIPAAGKEAKPAEPDRRRALDPNVDFIKKRAPTFVIKEEPEKALKVEDLVQMKLGPGMYDQNFRLVEKRVDVGHVKLQELTEKNARENQMDPSKQIEVFDNEDLYPNIQAVKPNPKSFQYHEKTESEVPHLPDKALFQSRWNFYDYDLNKVREDFGKGGNIGYGGNRGEFAEHEEFMHLMHAYFEKQKKQPQLGEYDPVYKLIERQQMVPDFENYQGRNTDPIEKPEGPVDGDNLILNPDRPQPKLPDINMKRMTGRPEQDQADIDSQPVLIINPEKPQHKIKGQVQLDKQLRREDYEEAKERAQEETKLDLNPNYQYLDRKVKGFVEYDKQDRYPEDHMEQQEVELKLDPNYNVNKPAVKKQVDMARGEKRFA